MKKGYYFISILTIALVIIYSCEKKIGLLPPVVAPISANACDSVKYSVDIQPILTARCVGCHSSSGQDFSNYTGTKAQVDNGKFETRVLNMKNMPADSPLSQADFDKVKCWFDKGAPNN